MSGYVGIIGYPLGHSISAGFQQAALDHCGLDLKYQVWETRPEDLAETVGGLRQPGYLGANVTIPYKEEVPSMLDGLDGVAGEIGAVNTIVSRDGKLTGYNTDATGFLRALREDARFDPAGKKAVVLGAGGAARAVSYSLLLAGVSGLTLLNRSVENGEAVREAMEDMLSRKGLEPQVRFCAWEGRRVAGALAGCDLIVNCTPLGMRHSAQEGTSPLRAEQIPAEALVYDLVYNPPQTPLRKEASRAGARSLGGLPMLVYQGAAAFELWTGRQAPLEVMLHAARAALS